MLVYGQASGVLEEDGAAVGAPFGAKWCAVEHDAVGLLDDGVPVVLVVHLIYVMKGKQLMCKYMNYFH